MSDLFELFPFDDSDLFVCYQKDNKHWKEIFGFLHNDEEISEMLEDPYLTYLGYSVIRENYVRIRLLYFLHSNGNTYEFRLWDEYISESESDIGAYESDCDSDSDSENVRTIGRDCFLEYSIEIVSKEIASKRIQFLPTDHDGNSIDELQIPVVPKFIKICDSSKRCLHECHSEDSVYKVCPIHIRRNMQRSIFPIHIRYLAQFPADE